MLVAALVLLGEVLVFMVVCRLQIELTLAHERKSGMICAGPDSDGIVQRTNRWFDIAHLLYDVENKMIRVFGSAVSPKWAAK